VEVGNAMALASAHEDAKGLARKVVLLEDELTVEHWAREVFERENRAYFKELTLLQTQGAKLCHVIVGPPWAKHHLLMQPSVIQRWLENSLRFGQRCPLPWSRCSSTRPVTLLVRGWWVSWSLNSTWKRGDIYDLSGLLHRSVTCFLGYCPIGPGWLTVWTGPPDSLEWSWPHGGRPM
jgi:hypothetical protein